MRLGVWLCAAGLFCAACSGGYPLPPTLCDDWCDANEGTASFDCNSYYPAQCVSACEDAALTTPECRPQFEVALACYRRTPEAEESAHCNYIGPQDMPPAIPCSFEMAELANCVAPYAFQF